MGKRGWAKLAKYAGLVILLILFGVLVTINKSNQCCSPDKPPQGAITNTNPAVPPAGQADNPLAIALTSGQPVVADFGRGTCIPCKMMKPILDELKQTYKGRAEVLFFDIGEYRDLTAQYKINLIPTQIFFDKTGKEVWRHEGFLEKEKITAKLTELGVN